MSHLLAVHRSLERGLNTTGTAGEPHYEEQEQQDKAAGNVLQRGLSREPGLRWEWTRRGLLEMLGLNSNAYRVEDPTGRAADGDFPGDFGSVGAPTHLEDALGGFNFVAMKYVK